MQNNFRDEEIVKVQGKQYPLVGGRLRLAHEENKALSVQTSIIEYSADKAVIQATVVIEKGVYTGLGMASVTRDAKLKNAILELAETRAIARALRFAGYGVEYTGFEEMPGDDEPAPQKNHTNTNPNISDKQIEELITIAASKGFKTDKVLKAIKKDYNKTKLEELTIDQYKEMKERLEKLPDKEVGDGE